MQVGILNKMRVFYFYTGNLSMKQFLKSVEVKVKLVGKDSNRVYASGSVKGFEHFNLV